jgi:hypothetical protein
MKTERKSIFSSNKKDTDTELPFFQSNFGSLDETDNNSNNTKSNKIFINNSLLNNDNSSKFEDIEERNNYFDNFENNSITSPISNNIKNFNNQNNEDEIIPVTDEVPLLEELG